MNQFVAEFSFQATADLPANDIFLLVDGLSSSVGRTALLHSHNMVGLE